MNIKDRIKTNCRRPEGFFGRRMISHMNESHRTLHEWGLSKMELCDGTDILDVGCGGGTVIARLAKRLPKARIYGLDYSGTSVEYAKKTNKAAVADGRVKIVRGDINAMPYDDCSFDVITSFENYYFWDDFDRCTAELRRTLKEGGVLYVVGEAHDTGEPNPRIEHFVEIMNMKYLTGGSLGELLKKAGFSSVDVSGKADGRIFAVCVK